MHIDIERIRAKGFCSLILTFVIFYHLYFIVSILCTNCKSIISECTIDKESEKLFSKVEYLNEGSKKNPRYFDQNFSNTIEMLIVFELNLIPTSNFVLFLSVYNYVQSTKKPFLWTQFIWSPTAMNFEEWFISHLVPSILNFLEQREKEIYHRFHEDPSSSTPCEHFPPSVLFTLSPRTSLLTCRPRKPYYLEFLAC